jgi:hypothetical protein
MEGPMNNTIIIKIESGVVADIYSTGPLQAIIVDYDMIEGGETFEHRMKKAVLPMTAEQCVKPENIDDVVKTLVLECSRPADRLLPIQVNERVEVTA